MSKNGEYHLQGCGNCSQIWTNFNQKNGMLYGSEPIYFHGYHHCDLWIWYKDKVEINYS